MGRLEEYLGLLRRSERFYTTALMQAERGMYDLAVFSLEQSLQLYLKAVLLKNGVDFPCTRGVRSLLNMLAELAEKENIKQLQTAYSIELGSLEDAYIVSRYLPRTYTAEEFGRLRERVRAVVGEVLVGEARRRKEIFDNLETHLRRLAEVVKRLDPGCEVYLFGSVAEGRHLYSSDVDVLVVSDVLKPGEVLAVLWREGFREPFEVHVVDRASAEAYRRRARLKQITTP